MKIFFNRLNYFLPIPLLVIGLNYFMDPANLFNEKYEMGIVNYLVQDYQVTNVVNYNERLLQKLYINKMQVCPQEIVLGSSRIMQIHSGYSTMGKLINNGVSGATLEDDLAIYYLYEKKGCKIKKVILGLDPWLLNDNHNQDRWKTLGAEYTEFRNKINNTSVKEEDESAFNKYEVYNELFSFSYFKTSLNYLFAGIDKTYKPVKTTVNPGFTRLTDGSVTYDTAYRNASVTNVEEKVHSTLTNSPIYSLGNFIQLSRHYQLIFSDFIAYLQHQHIEVEFFLSPYHPQVYKYFKNHDEYHNIFEAEKYFTRFAQQHSIKVYGSYDPSKYNLSPAYFYDGLHCNEKAVESIIKDNLSK